MENDPCLLCSFITKSAQPNNWLVYLVFSPQFKNSLPNEYSHTHIFTHSKLLYLCLMNWCYFKNWNEINEILKQLLLNRRFCNLLNSTYSHELRMAEKAHQMRQRSFYKLLWLYYFRFRLQIPQPQHKFLIFQ